MTRDTIKRTMFNIILVILSVISIIAAGFISKNEYNKKKVNDYQQNLEIYTDQQIIHQVMADYSAENGFSENDIQNVSINVIDENKTFTATADITKKTNVSEKSYSVNYSYNAIDGQWILDEKSREFRAKPMKWLVQGTKWKAAAEDRSQYIVEFTSITEANVSVEEVSSETAGRADANDTGWHTYPDFSGRNQRETVSSFSIKDKTCELEKESDQMYSGDILRPDGTVITLKVTSDAVTMDLGSEKGEIILEKE